MKQPGQDTALLLCSMGYPRDAGALEATTHRRSWQLFGKPEQLPRAGPCLLQGGESTAFIAALQKVKPRAAQQSTACQDHRVSSSTFNKPGQAAPPHQPLPDTHLVLAATLTLPGEAPVNPDEPPFFGT